MIIHLAYKNLWRNKRRTFYTELAIVFSIVIIVFTGAFLKGMFKEWALYQINGLLGSFQIEHKDFRSKSNLAPMEVMLTDANELIRQVESIPGIISACGELKIAGFISNGKKSTLFDGKGVDVEQQEKTLPGKDNLIKEGKPLKANGDITDVVIGQLLAERLDLHIDDTVTLAVRTYQGVLDVMYGRVAGIKNGNHFPSTTYVEMHLSQAQKLLRLKNGVSQILVRTRDFYKIPSYIQSVENKVKGRFPVVIRSHSELIDMYATVGGAFKLIAFVLGVVLLLITGIGIGNAMFMSVNERRKEIGTFMATGMDAFYVRMLFLSEGVLTGFTGVIAGIVGAFILIAIINSFGGIPFSHTIVIKPLIDWTNVLYAVFMSLIISLLASWIPASASARLNPIDILSEP